MRHLKMLSGRDERVKVCFQDCLPPLVGRADLAAVFVGRVAERTATGPLHFPWADRVAGV